MHQKQLTEHYYEILNEINLGGIARGIGRGARGVGRGISRGVGGGIDLAARGLDAISPLLPYAATGAGIYYGADLLKGLLRAVQPVSGQGKDFRGGSRRVVDANVARGLASGNQEDYYDYLADLQNSDMTSTQRSGSIIRTRALASKIARDRAAQMKEYALSDKTAEGKAYLAAKAEFDALKGDEVDAEPLTGTRPDGTSFSVGGKKMGPKKKAAYDKMQAARKAALDKEHTVGEIEGKRPSNAAATANTPSNSGNPPSDPNANSPEDPDAFSDTEDTRKANEMTDDAARARALEEIEKKKREREGTAPKDPFGESFKNYYYNLLREQDTGGGIGNVPGAAEGKPQVDQMDKDAEKKRKEDEEQAKKAEEQAKKDAEEAENARLSSSVGSASAQMRIAASLQSGPMNLQPVERRGGGFSVGKGSMGQPVITGSRYINPNSPEGRIEAALKKGEWGGEGTWARDSSGRLIPGQGVQGGKLPMDLEAEQKAAGDEAASKKLRFNVTGLSQQQIRDKVRSNIKARNAKIEQELRDEDIQKNGPMPTNQMDPNDNAPEWELRNRILQNKEKEDNYRKAQSARREARYYSGRAREASRKAREEYLDAARKVPAQIGIPELLKDPEIEAGEDLLKSMQQYKGEVEADRLRNAPPTIGVPELLQKPVATQRDYVSVPPKSPDYPTPRTPEEEKAAGLKALKSVGEDIRRRKALRDARNKKIRDASAARGKQDFPKSPDYPTSRPLSARVKSNILKSIGKLKTSTIQDRDAIKSNMTDEWLDTMRKASKI